MDERQITACIDGSRYTSAVCDAAAWASLRLDTPLTFVHAIDRQPMAAYSDASGQIGLGAREQLLEELAQLDEKRARVAREQGRLMLEAAVERTRIDGVATPAVCQRNGELVETLVELQHHIRLLVLGRRGETADRASDHLGSNLERALRSLACPVLITTETFTAPERILIAFDGSHTAERLIERVSASPLFRDMECHLVCVGEDSEKRRDEVARAGQQLAPVCARVTTAIVPGDVEAALNAYAQGNAIDMLVMGAYGHSRIRQLLVGSTTTQMIRGSRLPLLILR